MTDMRSEWLPQGTDADHTDLTLSIRVALCPPPPVARVLSNPSWKVIVSASRGQYLKPGSASPAFFRAVDFQQISCDRFVMGTALAAVRNDSR